MTDEDATVIKMLRSGFGPDSDSKDEDQHAAEGFRLIRAFLKIEDKRTRDLVIQIAEALGKPTK